MTKSLSDVLERMTAAAQSLMDSARPSDEHNDCPMCLLPATEATERDPDCAWRIAKAGLSQADVNEVLRLARVLRYDGNPVS